MDTEREFMTPCSVAAASGRASIAGSGPLAPGDTPAVWTGFVAREPDVLTGIIWPHWLCAQRLPGRASWCLDKMRAASSGR